jgi:hypothetical protein
MPRGSVEKKRANPPRRVDFSLTQKQNLAAAEQDDQNHDEQYASETAQYLFEQLGLDRLLINGRRGDRGDGGFGHGFSF